MICLWVVHLLCFLNWFYYKHGHLICCARCNFMHVLQKRLSVGWINGQVWPGDICICQHILRILNFRICQCLDKTEEIPYISTLTYTHKFWEIVPLVYINCCRWWKQPMSSWRSLMPVTPWAPECPRWRPPSRAMPTRSWCWCWTKPTWCPETSWRSGSSTCVANIPQSCSSPVHRHRVRT